MSDEVVGVGPVFDHTPRVIVELRDGTRLVFNAERVDVQVEPAEVQRDPLIASRWSQKDSSVRAVITVNPERKS